MTKLIARTRHDDAVVVSQTVTFDEVGALTTAVVDHIVADGVELKGVVAAAGDTGDSDAVETDCRSGETATGVSVREGYRVGGVVVVARPAKEVLCDKSKGIALLKADEIEDMADKVFPKGEK